MLLFTLISCTSAPEGPDYIQRFGAAPEAVIAEVSAMPDPVRQEAAVIQLCEAYPGYTAQLCAALPDGPARLRCDRFNARPHLWSITPDTPSTGRLGLPAPLLGMWQDTDADSSTCRADDHACLEARVRQLAPQDAIPDIAATCKAYVDRRLESDCFFAASELLPYGPDLYPRAMRLCAGSGMYAHECHGHVLLRMRVDDPEPLSAARLLQEEDAIARFWAAQSPDFAPEAIGLYWSTTMARDVGTVQPFPAALRGVLPQRLMPHLRSAVALRVINEDDPIETARAVMRGEPRDIPRAFMPPIMPEKTVWRGRPADAPVSGWIFFNDVRGGKRPVHADPDIDLHLAVMTAVAMRNPPRTALLEALQEDPRPTVSWAARRLLQPPR